MAFPKILLVDDVDFFLEIQKGFLKQTPATVLTAKNGREALQVAASYRPDVIFMDVQMPIMDGLSCLKKLKADPILHDIPVIMVFAPSKEFDDGDCLAAGAAGVLHKPVDRNAFLELGHRFLFDIDRRERRIPCQALVTLEWQGRELHCRSEDISVHGAYLHCREEPPVDDRVKVTMVLPGTVARIINCRGRIAWLNQGFPRPRLKLPQGFGIEFKEVPREAVRQLQEFVEEYGKTASGEAGVAKG